jgi:hypothetical protein
VFKGFLHGAYFSGVRAANEIHDLVRGRRECDYGAPGCVGVGSVVGSWDISVQVLRCYQWFLGMLLTQLSNVRAYVKYSLDIVIA